MRIRTVTLLSLEPEVQYVALRNINLIVQKRADILVQHIKVGVCGSFACCRALVSLLAVFWGDVCDSVLNADKYVYIYSTHILS